MTHITIQDTGKRDTSSASATETQAYGDTGAGTTLELKGAEVTANFESMITADSPVLKKYEGTATAYFVSGKSDRVGLQCPTWALKGFIRRDVANDMITFGRLLFMGKTGGYKKLYSADDGTWHDIIAYSRYGERESNSESTKTVSYLNVSIKSISVTQSNARGFYYTVNLVETE